MLFAFFLSVPRAAAQATQQYINGLTAVIRQGTPSTPYTYSTVTATSVTYEGTSTGWASLSTLTDYGDQADISTWTGDFSVELFGYFLPPRTAGYGTYTFASGSDDASYMWIGADALNPTFDNALIQVLH